MGLFHEYDIRGIYGAELTEDFAYRLGYAIIKFTKARNVVIGYDSRHGNLKLFSALAKAITEQGVDVMHLGLVSRPMLNWVTWKHKYDLGIIITASHNPKEYNGFKFNHKSKLLTYNNGLSQVEELLKSKDFKTKKKKTGKKGSIISKDYIDEYVNFLSSHLSPEFKKHAKKNNVRIVVDTSNGACGEIVKKFLLKNDVTYELLFQDPDGSFFCHNPNPLDDNALVILSKKVREFKADLGAILDPDGDRIRFVDDRGEIVENNYLDCIVIKDILKSNKNAAIVHDIIARKILSETIQRSHGKNIVSEVGTSNIVRHMAEEKAIFSSEMSGHRYFKVMNYYDSGMMMLVYTLNSLYNKEHLGKRLSKLWPKYGRYSDLGEINIKIDNNSRKDEILKTIYEHYKKMKKQHLVRHEYTIDGVDVVTKRYWFTIRKSNTEPLLRLRIEGKDKKELLKVKKHIESFVK